MKSKIIAILCILSISCAIMAKDDPRIERIRRLYQEARKMETAEAYMPAHEVKFESILAAIGNQTTRVTFIYTSWQADPEKDPYLMGHRLLKVNVKYNVAAMTGYSVEYLYDEKERPVFYYSRNERESYADSKPVKMVNERRYYFDGGSLIAAMVDVADDDGKKEKYNSTGTFKQNDIACGRKALSNAERYLKFFRHMVEIERLK